MLAKKRYNMFDTIVLKGKGWGLTIGLLALAVMIELLNNLYWNVQSKKFNKHTADNQHLIVCSFLDY